MSEIWVVGVDGSDQAQVALDWAVRQAQESDVTIRAVSAWQFPYVGVGPFTGTAVSLPVDELTEGVTRALDRAIERAGIPAGSGVTVEPMLVEGPSAQALLHVAEGADLLVVGSRGRGGFARLLLGSVGHQCASHADVPTVIVPSTTEPGDLALVKVGVDGSPNSLAALRWACRHVPATATVEAIQMWSPPELGIDGLDPRILEDMAEAAERRFRAKVTEVQAEVDTTIAVRFVHDDARRRLAEESAAADLVVVGSRGRRGLTGAILGSVATWLLHHTVCPVAVVPG